MYGPPTHEQTQIDIGGILRGEFRNSKSRKPENVRAGIGKIKRSIGIDIPSVVTGAGTALMGALGYRLIDLLSSELTEPKLELRFQDGMPPYCWTQPVTEPDEQLFLGIEGLAHFVRVEVYNTGRNIAKTCNGQISRIANLDNPEAIGKSVPVFLQWVSGLRKKEDTTVNIGRKGSAFLGILLVPEGHNEGKKGLNEDGFTLDMDINAPNFGAKRRGHTGKRYAIEFDIWGEGFESVKGTLEVMQTMGVKFTESLVCQLRKGSIESNYGF